MTSSPIEYPLTSADVETVRRCPACDAHDHVEIAEVSLPDADAFLTTSVCQRCSLIFRSRRPTLDWFGRMWTLRHESQVRRGQSPINAAVERERYARYARTAATLRRHGFGRRLIDVGCGPATGLRAFAEAGFAVVGLEPDASRARQVEVPGVEIVEQTIEGFDAARHGLFDGATCQHSLEHFYRPLDVLRTIATWLRPGALIFIEVPDARSVVRDWNDALYLAHQTNFTAESLERMGRRAGLEVVACDYPPSGEPDRPHLSCVFRRGADLDGVESADIQTDTGAAFVDEVRTWYRRGLPATPPGVLRFRVPCINDLSLTYKPDPANVRATVAQNTADRTVEFKADEGVFCVGPA